MAVYIFNGVDTVNNKLVVTLPTGNQVSLDLATYNTKALIIAQLKTLSMANKPVIPAGVTALVGKWIDDTGADVTPQ